ncbi:hypothetical protein HKBW3S43_01268, partial [Candidatus Hakubella thermalkaliphila]
MGDEFLKLEFLDSLLFSRQSPMHRGAPRRMKIGLFSR